MPPLFETIPSSPSLDSYELCVRDILSAITRALHRTGPAPTPVGVLPNRPFDRGAAAQDYTTPRAQDFDAQDEPSKPTRLRYCRPRNTLRSSIRLSRCPGPSHACLRYPEPENWGHAGGLLGASRSSRITQHRWTDV